MFFDMYMVVEWYLYWSVKDNEVDFEVFFMYIYNVMDILKS